MNKESPSFILLFQSKDQKGIVAAVTDLIFRKGGNIINAEQYSTDPVNGRFFLRIEFCCGSGESVCSLGADFAACAEKFQAGWNIYDCRKRMRMGIMASKPGHCLFELLYQWRSGELAADIPFVISNCEEHRQLVSQFGIPFHFIATGKSDRGEPPILTLVKDSCDFLVLARYMLTLSGGFLNAYGKDIINIHHGLLPAFTGANPYRQAHEKGVKIIGATAHFVTEKLDEGPIICQKAECVSHKDDVRGLARKGRNLEKHALSSAVADYIGHRVIRSGDKTIVFSA
jgi:formyltetrahydrofolate deformylase